jgi:hypothetical protein
MDVHYGKPKICEMKGCEGKSICYDWAKKTGMEYERNRDNFLRLCRSCHRRYDLTKELRDAAMKNLWWARGRFTGSAKLDWKKVESIRELFKKNVSSKELSEKYGVDITTIQRVNQNKLWKK